MILLITLLVVCCSFIYACDTIELVSAVYGNRIFHATVDDASVFNTGRLTYVSDGDSPLYIYHVSNSTTSIGRWIINDEVDSGMALAFCDSWAVTPAHIADVNEGNNKYWMVSTLSFTLHFNIYSIR